MQYSSDLSIRSRIYLDHNATTPPSAAIKEKWLKLFDLWGNPSSIHTDSRSAKLWLRETRQKISQLLGISSLEVIFNSGASEGNSTILNSVWLEKGADRPEFLISAVEHPSVLKTAEYLKSFGAIVHYIPISQAGQIDLAFIKKNLSHKTALVSVMFANNETGTIFPIAEIAGLAHQTGALMHTDCVQLLGKSSVDFKSLNVDYATFSAHKFYGLKGTGFVFVKKSSPWVPLIHGGGQERSRRGGTENILGIAALGISLEQLSCNSFRIEKMENLRDLFEAQVMKKIVGVRITAAESLRLSNTSSLIIDGVDGETLLMSLDLKGFSVSTGAACSSGNPEPSPVLIAMGLTRAEAQNSLRVSLGWGTTQENICDFLSALIDVVAKLREIDAEERLQL